MYCYFSSEERLIREKFFLFILHEYSALAASCDFFYFIYFIFKIIFFVLFIYFFIVDVLKRKSYEHHKNYKSHLWVCVELLNSCGFNDTVN